MAAVPEQLVETAFDRRTVPRDDVSLGVTLHHVDDDTVIPAAIANLSASGFLAELSADAVMPDFLDVDLPNGGRRKAQVVWQSGTMAGCNFTVPLGRGDLSAARLKSAFAEPADPQVPPIDPADPIWDVANVAARDEKWPLGARIALIAAAAVVPWTSMVGLALVLA